MNIACVFLMYGSTEEHQRVVMDNFYNADYPFTAYTLNIQGLAVALNNALDIIHRHDAVLILGNDITEPEGYLRKRVECFERNRDAGVISIPIGESFVNDREGDIIGNYFITREAVHRVGYFTNHFDPYGPIDLDYTQRVRKAGLKTMYVGGCKAGTISANGDDKYGFSKSIQVQKTWQQHVEDVAQYGDGRKSIYIPKPDYVK